MLWDAAAEMASDGRIRLWMLDLEGEPISAHLFVAAGGQVTYWLGGFDERWARYQPSMQTIIVAMEHAWEQGDERFNLGGGDNAYKYRIADDSETLTAATIVLSGPAEMIAHARLAPQRLQRAVLDRLSTEAKDRIRRALGRPTSGHDWRSGAN